MCGICGIFDNQSQLSAIASMNQTQQHRGPDDEGFVFVNTTTQTWQTAGGADTISELDLMPYQDVDFDNFNLVLGNRRLAILDLSAGGHMPMSRLGGALWITHNGEIYNYRELKKKMEVLGHTFQSETDTEVILAAYAEWGTECLSLFNGMFAFVLWDSQHQRLFCARDRFGIKPLYYYWNGSTFVFASEIKSLIQHPAVPKVPNDQAIFDYLSLGLSDHTEQTFFENIMSLPPGHFLILQVPERQLSKQRWWQADINPSIAGSLDFTEKVYAQFSELLEDAIRLRLRSDVPVGSCLSGGLDSSSIVCFANRLLLDEKVIPDHLVGEHQKTFTARNREAEIDEYKFSHRIVQQTGAEENLVFPTGEMLWKEIESFVWHMDEPVDSTSQYPQWNVMHLAQGRGVTVLLDGQGGDEILAGYYAYYPPYLSQIRHQKGLMAAIKAGWEISRVGGTPVVDTLWLNTTLHFPWRLQQLARRLSSPKPLPGGGGSGLQEWQLSTDFVKRFWDRRWQPAMPINSNGLVGVLYRDLTSTNLPKLLRYEDRNSMAFSLETRLPFLDYRLVEMVFSLPLDYRIHKGWNKWILRRSLKDILPEEVCWRRSKLGYPTPEINWLRQGSNYIRHLFRRPATDQLTAYIQPGVLQKIREQSNDGLAATPGLWRMINLIIWLDLFF